MRRLLCLIFILLVLLTACSWEESQIPAIAEPVPTQPRLTAPPIPASPTVLPEPTWTAIAPPEPTWTATALPELSWTATALTEPTSQTRNLSLVGKMFTCPPADQILNGGRQAGEELPVYTARVVAAYPHDAGAYTQGLIFRDGYLYESTGLYGASSLRRVDLGSGEVVQQSELPEAYFGEGISALGERIYQLTWQEGIGFVYDAETFQVEKSFPIPGEGWGLTTDGARLMLSDGSSQLIFLDPERLQATGGVVVRDGAVPVEFINELEYIEGEVWANIYKSACIARIDPNSGQVVGWVDISGLLTPQEMAAAEVPNGIAYDAQTGRIFVTGKWWPRLFEIELEQVNEGD